MWCMLVLLPALPTCWQLHASAQAAVWSVPTAHASNCSMQKAMSMSHACWQGGIRDVLTTFQLAKGLIPSCFADQAIEVASRQISAFEGGHLYGSTIPKSCFYPQTGPGRSMAPAVLCRTQHRWDMESTAVTLHGACICSSWLCDTTLVMYLPLLLPVSWWSHCVGVVHWGVLTAGGCVGTDNAVRRVTAKALCHLR